MILRGGKMLGSELSDKSDVGERSETGIQTESIVIAPVVESQMQPNCPNECVKKPLPSVIPFDPDSGMRFEAWIKYFQNSCAEVQLEESSKIEIFSSVLKGGALQVFINSCLGCKSLEEVTAIFNEHFVTPTVSTFSEYNRINFNGGMQELQKYFNTKMEVGRRLGMSPTLLLQGLNDGLPAKLKPLVLIREPSTPIDWLNLVASLVQCDAECNENNRKETRENRRYSPQYQNWDARRTDNFERPNNFQSRAPQWSQRQQTPVWRQPPPFQNRYRGFPQNRDRFLPNTNRRETTHYQQRLPPRPCRYCENAGLLNAFHWERTCPLKPNMTFDNPSQMNLEVEKTLSENPQNSS
jgi:hypothetical protein